MALRTIMDLFHRDTELPRERHLTHATPDSLRTWSTGEVVRAAATLAEALKGLGVRAGTRVMLLSDNRPEWLVVDLAVQSLRAITVPVYSTLTAEQITFQARDSGAAVAVADHPTQMAKLVRVREACPELQHLVQIEGRPERGVRLLDSLAVGVDVPAAVERFWRRAGRVREDDPLTIIYTSGTTGEPKGVLLTHRNLVQNVLAAAPRVPVGPEDLALEFLPLSHVLERMLSYVYMYRATRRAYCAVPHVADLIGEIAPTVLCGVPRFFEKIHDSIVARAASSALKREVFSWALQVGLEAARRRLAGGEVGAVLEAQLTLADRLVFEKIRAGLGGRLRVCVSGGAPLRLDIAEFFHAVGIPLVEGYGLTETSPVIAVNGLAPGTIRLGTVGRPLPNVEVRLAEDGEILVRGPSVMQRYWNNPAATAEVIDGDGFFHTGDIGEIDDDGFLLITDRKKELIVTAGGKNVAPAPIEAELKTSPLIEQAVLLGDGRPYIVALLSPGREALEAWAGERGLAWSTWGELVEHPLVQAALAEVVERVNARLARYETIKRFAVVATPFTIDGGQLTPTLKVKRRVVERQFAREIERLYAE